MAKIDTIKISSSNNSGVPSDLTQAELHFNYLENSLYIGNPVPGESPIQLLSGEFASRAYRDFSLSAVYYVSVDSANATDDSSNTGQSITRPFSSIERAIVQGVREGRRSYSVVVLPGIYRIINRPGTDINSIGAGLFNTPNYFYNREGIGGVIVPPGCSIFALSPGNTYVKPEFIPNNCGQGSRDEFDITLNGGLGGFKCILSTGNPDGTETGIFLLSNDSQVSGLSFRDKDFTLRESEYFSSQHNKLFCLGTTTEAEVLNLYAKINKTFEVDFSPAENQSSEITNITNIDLLSLHGMGGIKSDTTETEILVFNSRFETTGVSIRGENCSTIEYRNITILNSSVGIEALTGSKILGDNVSFTGIDEHAFRAVGGSSDNLTASSNSFRFTELIPPKTIQETERIELYKIDVATNYDYHRANIGAYDRLYVQGEPNASYDIRSGEVLYFGNVEGFANVEYNARTNSSSLVLDPSTSTYYIPLDPNFTSVNEWSNFLDVSMDFESEDTGSLPSTLKGKINTKFSQVASGSIKVDRRFDSRADVDRIFRVVVQNPAGGYVPEKGDHVNITSLPSTPNSLYAADVETIGVNTYILTLLPTNFSGSSVATSLDIFPGKNDSNPEFNGTGSQTYEAVNSIPLLSSTLANIIANEIGTSVTLSAALKVDFSFRKSSLIKSQDNIFYKVDPSLRKESLSGGLVFLCDDIGDSEKRFDLSTTPKAEDLELETLNLTQSLNLVSGSTFTIEEGVTINPTNKGGEASFTDWGFTKLADLSALILDCKGNPEDALVLGEVDSDPQRVVTHNLLKQVVESKTAKAVDLLDPTGDSRKFVASSDLSTTTLIGVSRVSTLSEIVTSLQGDLSQTANPLPTVEANFAEFVNPTGFYEGLKSVVSSDAQRGAYTPGVKLIVSEHVLTTTEAGIAKLEESADAIAKVGGTSTVTGLTAIEQEYPEVINPYVLKEVLDSKTASQTDLQNGTGNTFVTAGDLADTDLYGLVRLADNQEIVDDVVSPNASGVANSTELNDPDGIINKWALFAAFEGKKATDFQRQGNANTDDRFLVNYADRVTVAEYGIGRLVNYATSVADLQGDITKLGASVTAAEESESDGLVNYHVLNSSIKSLYADDTELSTPTGTPGNLTPSPDFNGNRILRSVNRMTTDTYGIGALDTQPDALSIIGGTNTDLTATTAGELATPTRLINSYLLKNIFESVRATDTERQNGTNSFAFITATHESTREELGLVRAIHPGADFTVYTNIASIMEGDASVVEDKTGGPATSMLVPTLPSVRVAIESKQCSDVNRADPTIVERRWVSINQHVDYDLWGTSRLATPDEAVTFLNGNELDPRLIVGPVAPDGLVQPVFYQAGDDAVINSKVLERVLLSRVANDLQMNDENEVEKFVTPSNIADQGLKGVTGLATDSELTRIIGLWDGDASVITAESPVDDDPDSVVSARRVMELVKSVVATTAKRQTFGVNPNPLSLDLITNDHYANNTTYGIVKEHILNRFTPDVVLTDYMSVQSTLDPFLDYRSINRGLVERFAPAGEIVEWAGNSGQMGIGGFLPCDGTAYSVTQYADLSATMEGVWGNPSPLGATFLVPVMAASADNAVHAWKFIRI